MGRAVNPTQTRRSVPLTTWIFVGMAVGVALGLFAPGFAQQLGPVSNIFLRLIRSIIAPLLFGTLVWDWARSTWCVPETAFPSRAPLRKRRFRKTEPAPPT